MNADECSALEYANSSRPPEPFSSSADWRVNFAVLVSVFATRVPLVFLDYGAGHDADSWRLYLAGRMWVDTGVYRSSRPPSYPALEAVSAALSFAPIWVHLLMTALVGAVGVAAFGDLLRRLSVRSWMPATIAFALTPVIYRISLTFMDYSWGLSAFLVSLCLWERGRFALAGATFGLAIAFRPSTGFLLCTFVVLIMTGDYRKDTSLRFAITFFLVAGSFYAISFWPFGLRMFQAFPVDPGIAVIAGRLSTGVWGSLGAITAAPLIVVSTVVVLRRWSDFPARQVQYGVAAAVGSAATVLVFLALPADEAYLAPVVPLGLLCLAVFTSPIAISILAVSLAISSFLAPSNSTAFGTTVLQDRAVRARDENINERILAAVSALPPGTTVVLGARLPQFLSSQPRSILSAPYLNGPNRSVQIPEAVILPGGQLVAYAEVAGRPNQFQLSGTPGRLPTITP